MLLSFALPFLPTTKNQLPQLTKHPRHLHRMNMTLETTQKAKSEQQPVPDSSGSFANVDGVHVHYKLTEPSNQVNQLPLHICMHGFGASCFSFSLLTHSPHLSYRPPSLAYDAPGFGLTARPRKLSFYSPLFSARIASALAYAFSPSRKYVLMAHSMGTLAASRLLLQEPHRISAIVLISPAILPASSLPKYLQTIIRLVALAFVNLAIGISSLLTPVFAAFLRRLVAPERFWQVALRQARHPSRELPQEVVDGYRLPLQASGWETGILNFTKITLKERAKALGTSEDFVEMIRNMNPSPKLLIVHGDSDMLVPLENSKTLADRLQANLVVMQNCGHVPHEEDPVEFSKIVYEFLQEVQVL